MSNRFRTSKAFRTVDVFPFPGFKNNLAPPFWTISFIPRTCSGFGSNEGLDFDQSDVVVVMPLYLSA